MRLSEDLIQSYSSTFQKAVDHPLVKELCAGTLSDKALYVYLTQDTKYFRLYIQIILKTAYLCDSDDAKIGFGKQIGFISNDENTYFDKAIRFLLDKDPSLGQKYNPKTFMPDEVQAYIDMLTKLSARLETYSYAQLVTYLWTTEVIYLKWAKKAMQTEGAVAENLHWRYKEWITLHCVDNFEAYVDFLQNEVDRLVDRDEVDSIFRKTVDMEYGFFEACYRNR